MYEAMVLQEGIAMQESVALYAQDMIDGVETIETSQGEGVN